MEKPKSQEQINRAFDIMRKSQEFKIIAPEIMNHLCNLEDRVLILESIIAEKIRDESLPKIP